jgi:predicted Rossmann fold nucleotide-binding protein DprA/Smf involved in DNA uptake
MLLDVTVIEPTASNFPSALRARDGTAIFPRIWAIGDLAILEKRLLGLFCSTQCPGEVILRTYDIARALRDAGVPVISGFHSPMEKECLDLLLRGTQPVVICLVRSIEQMHIPRMWREELEEGRLLLLSPFEPDHRRITAPLAEQRNWLVACLARKVFVAYAAPRSKTEQLCFDLLKRGKEVITFDCETNANLIERDALCLSPSDQIPSL